MNSEKPRVAKEEKDSFCVWTKTGHRPKFFHPTLELAEAEAVRLALSNRGKKFLVMQMISKFSAEGDGGELLERMTR